VELAQAGSPGGGAWPWPTKANANETIEGVRQPSQQGGRGRRAEDAAILRGGGEHPLELGSLEERGSEEAERWSKKLGAAGQLGLPYAW